MITGLKILAGEPGEIAGKNYLLDADLSLPRTRNETSSRRSFRIASEFQCCRVRSNWLIQNALALLNLGSAIIRNCGKYVFAMLHDG